MILGILYILFTMAAISLASHLKWLGCYEDPCLWVMYTIFWPIILTYLFINLIVGKIIVAIKESEIDFHG
jgi:hypothetical protein